MHVTYGELPVQRLSHLCRLARGVISMEPHGSRVLLQDSHSDPLIGSTSSG